MEAFHGTWAPFVVALTLSRILFEKLVELEPALAHHLGQRLSIGSVGTLLRLGRDRPRRGREGDHRIGLWIDQGQAAGERRARLGEGALACRVKDENRRLEVQGVEWSRIVGEAYCLGRYVEIALDPGIDRSEVILALELQTVAAEIDERDRVGPG